eukprot:SAG22_NODE_245_length_13962_cov_11.954555_2_plen_61_part_00
MPNDGSILEQCEPMNDLSVFLYGPPKQASAEHHAGHVPRISQLGVPGLRTRCASEDVRYL